MRKRTMVGLALFAAIAYGFFEVTTDERPPYSPVAKVEALDQGWLVAEAHSYHYTPQGTAIMPTAWLRAIEQPFSDRLLMDKENLGRFGFIVDGVTPDAAGGPNPYGWPIGFTSTRTQRAPAARFDPDLPEMAGLSCAACHTGQINYKGKAFRVEGGQAMFDAGAFQAAVGFSVFSTYLVPWKYRRFKERVLQYGYPGGAEKLDKDLSTAFWTAATLAWRSYMDGYSPRRLYPTREGPGRLDALQRIANTVFSDDLNEPGNALPGTAPVSFPYLWDIWLFDWVQYNASVRQPMIRNVGEALGVRAWVGFASGGSDGLPPTDAAKWRSSIRVEDLNRMEEKLRTLRPPIWPEHILGPIDRELSAKGQLLFNTRCASCHGVRHIQGTENPPEWQLKVLSLKDIGTDPLAAQSFIDRTYNATKLGASPKLSSAEGLKLVTQNVKDAAYEDLQLSPDRRRELDGFGRDNLVVAPCGYKARPLVGVWATPPFLHNGSVPTLFDLLSDKRPEKFWYGSREFDPVKVGYDSSRESGGRLFDTADPGNSNAGHWFTDDRSQEGSGRLGPAFSTDDKRALIEYLKAATYDQSVPHAKYPIIKDVPRPSPAPCVK